VWVITDHHSYIITGAEAALAAVQDDHLGLPCRLIPGRLQFIKHLVIDDVLLPSSA